MQTIQETNNLSHHGILGMRWGVRRYQNKDGSLTPAGRKKAAKMKDEYTALTGKRLTKKPSPKSTNSEDPNKKKSIKEMSDTELKDKINRLQMEKQAISLQNDLSSKGQKFVSTVGKQVIAPAAIDAGKRVLTDLFIKVGKDKLGLNPEATKDALKDLRKETEFAELRNRKLKAEKEYANRINKEKEKSENVKSKEKSENVKSKDKSNAEHVKAEFIKPDKQSNSSSKKRDSVIIDAEWSEVSPYSTAIIPYTNKGKDYMDDLFKKSRS